MSTVVGITDEEIREAVVQIMEMNGLSTGSNGSGWELKQLLEHAADTEAVLRALISGTILKPEPPIDPELTAFIDSDPERKQT